MANYTTMSLDATKLLCGLIRDLASVSEGIDNLHLADNLTFSNIYIKNLVDKCLEDANAEAQKLVGALTHLTCEETTVQPTLDNSEINVIYLYSADGNAPYQQYLKISDTKLVDLGSTSISLTNYLTSTEIARDYVTKLNFDSLKTTVDGKIDKTDIVDNLTSTDTDKPLSANQGKVLKDEVDLKANDSDVVKKSDIVTTISNTSTDDEVPSAKAVYSALSSNLKDAKIMFFDFEGEFNNTTLGVNSTNTITEVVRAFGNYIINNYGKEQYAILEFATNNNNSAFNQSLPNDKQSCIGTVKYMPWQHTNRVQVILTDLINGNSYIGSLNNSTTNDIVWQKVCTARVADEPMKFIAALDDSTNYTSHSTNGTKYYVKDGICEVSLYIDCTTPSDKVVNVLSGLPKAYTYSYFVIHAWNAGFSDYVMAEITPTGMLNLKKGTTGGSYLGTFSYMVKEE